MWKSDFDYQKFDTKFSKFLWWIPWTGDPKNFHNSFSLNSGLLLLVIVTDTRFISIKSYWFIFFYYLKCKAEPVLAYKIISKIFFLIKLFMKRVSSRYFISRYKTPWLHLRWWFGYWKETLRSTFKKTTGIGCYYIFLHDQLLLRKKCPYSELF